MENKKKSKRRFYDNGQMESSFNYKNGKREGLSQKWYRNGQLKYSEIYEENKKINNN